MAGRSPWTLEAAALHQRVNVLERELLLAQPIDSQLQKSLQQHRTLRVRGPERRPEQRVQDYAATVDLHMLASQDDFQQVTDMLTRHSAEVDSADEGGRTALMFAARYPFLACHYDTLDGALPRVPYQERAAHVLLNFGAVPDSTELIHQWTPLHFAVTGASLRVGALLIRFAVNRYQAAYNVVVDKKDVNGMTPVMMAAARNEAQMVELLATIGNADLDAKDFQGWTALHYCALEDSYEAAERLLKNGANYDVQNEDGNTALEVADLLGRGRTASVIFTFQRMKERDSSKPT